MSKDILRLAAILLVICGIAAALRRYCPRPDSTFDLKPAKQTLSAKVISKYCQTPVSSLMNRQQESISSLSNVLKQTARPTAISTQSIRTATAVK